LELGDVGFCGVRKIGEPEEKLSEQGENQQQTRPTYGTELVEGENSHHCAVPVPLIVPLSPPRCDVNKCVPVNLMLGNPETVESHSGRLES